MPLLNREPFVKARPPADIQKDDEVFYCKLTDEVFVDYDEFFERTILCNSLVWTCSLTGKGLRLFDICALSASCRRADLRKIFP